MANQAALDLIARTAQPEPMVHDFEDIEIHLKELEADICSREDMEEPYRNPSFNNDEALNGPNVELAENKKKS